MGTLWDYQVMSRGHQFAATYLKQRTTYSIEDILIEGMGTTEECNASSMHLLLTTFGTVYSGWLHYREHDVKYSRLLSHNFIIKHS